MAHVRAYAPGGIGNLGPGLDVFGCALDGAGDIVEARITDAPGVRIGRPGAPDLPTDPTRHASGIAASAVLEALGVRDQGVAIESVKGLPLAGGQGGSAASAVAGAVAVNALFGGRLDRTALLQAALAAESSIAGRHADNVAASLCGGIVLVRSIDPLEIVELPVPVRLRIVIVRPHYRLSTAESRRALPATFDLPTVVHQMAQVGTVVAALHTGDLELLGRAIDDRMAEPARTPLLPGFAQAKRAALDAGALGCSISGAGPSVFAIVDSDEAGDRVCRAMRDAYAAEGRESDGRVARVDQEGARIVAAR